MRRSLAVFVLALVVTGCQSFTMLQTPVPVAPGHVTAGIGAAVPVSKGDAGVFPEVSARIGLTSWADAGVKMSLGGMLLVDGKVQWVEAPIHLATDLGWSYHHWSGGSGNSTSITTIGWYPAVMIGDDHWYAGLRGTYIATTGQFDFFETQSVNGHQWICSDLFVGASIGGSFRVLPEFNFYKFKGSGKVTVVPAFGFQLNL